MCRKHCRSCSYRAISPFPRCVFERLTLQTRKNQGHIWEWVKSPRNRLWFWKKRARTKDIGCIPFTCSRTVYCVLEHCSGMLERNISAQFYCSVLNGVSLENCSFTLKYDSSFRHLESRGISVSSCATSRFI